MAHKPFNLYRRKTSKKNRYIYYCQFYDPETDKRLPGRSTHKHTKAEAEKWAIEELKKGIIKTPKNITFKMYAKDFWNYETSRYVQGKLARGVNMSRVYVATMDSFNRKYILPYFGDKKLQKINTRMIEDWLLWLREKETKTGEKLTANSINHYLSCLKIMLKQAVKDGYIHKNPGENITPFKQERKEKGVLILQEYNQLFDEDKIITIWEGNLKHYTINLLAATTGARMGELQGLQIQAIDFINERITFNKVWSRKFGLKEGAKWKSDRTIPLFSRTAIKYLKTLIETSPYQDPEDLVFYGKDGKTPIGHKIIGKHLYKALERIGISETERKKRDLTFHSWRHFFISQFEGKLSQREVMELSGHRQFRMNQLYTHIDFKDLERKTRGIAENIFN